VVHKDSNTDAILVFLEGSLTGPAKCVQFFYNPVST
jgi:hypothetical protein